MAFQSGILPCKLFLAALVKAFHSSELILILIWYIQLILKIFIRITLITCSNFSTLREKNHIFELIPKFHNLKDAGV